MKSSSIDFSLGFILIILSIVNITMHSLGCSLLITIYRKARKKTVQQLYLICHSVIIAVKNVLALLLVILELLPPNTKQDLSGFIEYLEIIFGIITYCYYSLMFFLTSDRLVGTILNYRYPLCWSIRKAKYLVASTIFINLIICVGLSITHGYLGHDKFVTYHIYAVFYTYIPTTLDVAFLVLAVFTYTIIFLKYSKSTRLSSGRKKSVHPADKGYLTSYSLFFKSRFLVSVFLISSFLLFSVIPGLIYACFEITGNRVPDKLLIYIYISFKVSDAAEAVIYIFLQRAVKKLLLEKIHILKRYCSGNKEKKKPSDMLVLYRLSWLSFIRQIYDFVEIPCCSSVGAKLLEKWYCQIFVTYHWVPWSKPLFCTSLLREHKSMWWGISMKSRCIDTEIKMSQWNLTIM